MKLALIILLERLFNFGAILAIIVMLLTAFIYQIFLHELPCPLCILQRLGFLLIAFGFLLNLKFGFRTSHYSLVIVSALFTAFVALRQVILHIVPGTGSYGSAILGLHMYTWSFIASMLIVLATSIMLGFDRQYEKMADSNPIWQKIAQLSLAFIALLLILNILSLFLECGISECPSNPTFYKLLSSL